MEDQRLRRTLDSMDICQSVLASFFVRTAIGEYDLQEPQQLIRLLVTMTRHKVASAARQQYRRKRDSRRLQSGDSQALAGIAKEELTPSGIVVGRELLQRARSLFRGEESQIAELRGQGQSWDEIAEQLGGTAQARRVQFARAVARVSEELGLAEAASE
jgi:DNA-directed RNA polymerase specialized sigma24 family protein